MADRPPPDQVASARAYLKSTAYPGSTMQRQGVGLAIDRLHPTFAVNLAKTIQSARAAGIQAGVSSSYRPPGFGVSGYRGGEAGAWNSVHSYGLGVDVQGIGGARSSTARQFEALAQANGVYNPYGYRNGKEYNHFQHIPTKGGSRLRAENPAAYDILRGTITRNGPNDLEKMWAAGDAVQAYPQMVAALGGEEGIRQYQASHGLAVDGTVGPQTANAIMADLVGQAPTVQTAAAAPQDAQTAIASLSDPGGGTQTPTPPTPLQGFLPPSMSGAGFDTPAQAAISEMVQGPSQGPAPVSQPLQLPPQWDAATGFPPPPPRRPGPGGALGVDLGMQPAGMPSPPSRPGSFDWLGGGAPPAALVPPPGISPLRPAFGGPGDRRPQPPIPPSRAQGIPLPPLRPGNFDYMGGGAPAAAGLPLPPSRPIGMPPSGPQKSDDSRVAAIQSIVDQGITDPNEIWGYLNMDRDGNRVGDITPAEIQAVLSRGQRNAPDAQSAIADAFGPGVPFMPPSAPQSPVDAISGSPGPMSLEALLSPGRAPQAARDAVLAGLQDDPTSLPWRERIGQEGPVRPRTRMENAEMNLWRPDFSLAAGGNLGTPETQLSLDRPPAQSLPSGGPDFASADPSVMLPPSWSSVKSFPGETLAMGPAEEPISAPPPPPPISMPDFNQRFDPSPISRADFDARFGPTAPTKATGEDIILPGTVPGASPEMPPDEPLIPSPDPIEMAIASAPINERHLRRTDPNRPSFLSRLLPGGGNGFLGNFLGSFGTPPAFTAYGPQNEGWMNGRMNTGMGGTIRTSGKTPSGTPWSTGTSNALGGSNALRWTGSGGQTITAYTDPNTGQTFHSFS